MTFLEMIAHPKWQQKRLRIMEREGFKCQVCEATEIQLHVHHLKYPERGNPIWDVPDTCLECLCKHCHDMRTEWNRATRQAIEILPTREILGDEYRNGYLEYNQLREAA